MLSVSENKVQCCFRPMSGCAHGGIATGGCLCALSVPIVHIPALLWRAGAIDTNFWFLYPQWCNTTTTKQYSPA